MADDQKLRGGYYTPEPIANFLARWAIRSPEDLVLEPSCGDGVLLEASARTLSELGAHETAVAEQLYGVELYAEEAQKSIRRIQALSGGFNPSNIHIGDFFSYCRADLLDKRLLGQTISSGTKFDVIIGNPPFIRYQNFPEEHSSVAFQIMEEAGYRPNRLTNAWLPFLVVSTMLLNSRGRLAMVIPAELFQVNYAAETRLLLSNYFSKLVILAFRQLVFPDIQQEIVLLLGEHNGSDEPHIQVVELDSLKDLASFEQPTNIGYELKPMDHSTEKWTQYFLDREEILLLRRLREHPDLILSGKVLDVDVGVVTGQNRFFLLTQEDAKRCSLEPHTQRIVARSAHLSGAIFSSNDWKQNLHNERAAYLFSPPSEDLDALPENVQDYILKGQAQNFHTGYKCRIRDRWYIVPSVWVPDAFMLRQVHGYPKIILNESGATCTDTIHRVRFINGANPRAVTAAFVNSLTLAFSEVTGRGYGGGVQTFEPSEAEKLLLPLKGAEELDLKHIDALLRKNDIESVLDITDKILLIQGLGLSKKDTTMLRGIWGKLRDRRINRKHTKIRSSSTPSQ